MLRSREERLAVVAARQAGLRRTQGRGRRPLFQIGHPRNELQALARQRPACSTISPELNILNTCGKVGQQ